MENNPNIDYRQSKNRVLLLESMLDNISMTEKVNPTTITLPLLLEFKGLNTNTLAQAINEKAGEDIIRQGRVWSIMKGVSKEPKDSSLAPIADYFRISVSELKDIEFVERMVGKTANGEDLPTPKDNGRDTLAELLDLMTPANKMKLLHSMLPSLSPTHRASIQRELAELQLSDLEKE